MNDGGDQTAGDRETGAEEALVGRRLRAIRQARGVSLAKVAAATGVSRSFLSLVEKGESDISFGRLQRLVSYYGIHWTDLVPSAPENIPGLVRAGSERHMYSRGEGIEVHLLAPDRKRKLMPLLSVLAPGAKTSDWEGHDGEEFLHVLEGQVEITLASQGPVILRQGDSISYGGRDGRALRNAGEREARLFAVIWPPL